MTAPPAGQIVLIALSTLLVPVAERVAKRVSVWRGRTFSGGPIPVTDPTRAVALFRVTALQDHAWRTEVSLAEVLLEASRGGRLEGMFVGVSAVEAYSGPYQLSGHVNLLFHRSPTASRRQWINSVGMIQHMFTPRTWQCRRLGVVLSMAEILGALAGPEQTAWTSEWPAHLAGIERSWYRPLQTAWYMAGFARAAVTWRLRAWWRGPAALTGRLIDCVLRSDTQCGLAVVAAVAVTTRWTLQTAGPAAASVVLIGATASSLTAVNQARKFRGIKRKHKVRKSAGR